jgi:CHAT domain-containing protein
VRPYSIALTDEQAGALADRIRHTTRIRGRALPDFDLDASMALYQRLLAPIADRLAQVKDLDVDTSGALASIPFAALVERHPDKAQLSSIHESQDYTGVAWLARRMSLSNVLGPAALIRLRKSASSPSSAPMRCSTKTMRSILIWRSRGWRSPRDYPPDARPRSNTTWRF